MITRSISIDSKSVESDVIEIQSRYLSDPTVSDIYLNKLNDLSLKYP